MGRARRAAAISSLTSLCLATLVAPAEAAGGSLTVTALDRSGHTTSAHVWLADISTHRQYSFSSTKSRTLPDGHYGVVVSIAPHGTDSGAPQTIGSRTFTIKGGRVTLRFDARRGKRISIGTNLAHPYRMMYEADICIAGEYLGGVAGADGVETYAIPTTNRKIRFSATAEWSPTQSGPYYWAVGKPTYGIPSRPGFSWAHTSFAKLSVAVRKGTVKERQTTLMMIPWATCSAGSESWATFAAPRTVTAYVTAGQWQPYIFYRGGQTGPTAPQTYKAGKTYHLTFTRKP
ncbi:hypothetical protein [Actinoallomurus rhizosphaericola]|uniref:hypothetical protein n=1 Tax=Actinoallomurus rhizosphaericola TaxID=2952536 RepID=UPI0020905537|nr:hypothetical protein [Actinoallomurus rhizosphaericola]MCO5993080.1 hypothetical protein [Actinoallomurus rhizosphaericola]